MKPRSNWKPAGLTLTRRELAKLAGCCERTLIRDEKAGHLRRVNPFGKTPIFCRVEASAYLFARGKVLPPIGKK